MPADTPTPNWSDRKLTYGVEATRSWTVKADSEAEAIDAVVAYTGLDAGSAHPLDNSLAADAPAATAKGMNYWTVSYGFKPPGQSNNQATDQKPKFRWTIATSSHQVDDDGNGNVILNAAGDVYDAVVRDFNDRGFIVRRREPFYDIAKANNFENTVNNADLYLLGGAAHFRRRELRLLSYIPVGEYDYHPDFLMCEYAFQVHNDTWKHRLLNKGNRGWATGPAGPVFLPFTDQLEGQPLTDILIDFQGIPLRTDVRVGSGRMAPIANPNGAPAGMRYQTKAGRSEYFTECDDYPESDFMGLEL